MRKWLDGLRLLSELLPAGERCVSSRSPGRRASQTIFTLAPLLSVNEQSGRQEVSRVQQRAPACQEERENASDHRGRRVDLRSAERASLVLLRN